jgi:hypothetical protein
LQRSAGNRAVEGLIQAKLAVSTPGDRYEREADRVATSIVSASASPAVATAATGGVQRKCAACAAGGDLCADCAGKAKVMRQVDRPAAGERAPLGDLPSLGFLGRGGLPLPPSVREQFEPRLGSDFGNVRVHTNATAAGAARSLNARAFTVGPDIAFAPGEFSPGTSRGRLLLAHELTHVLQQGAAGNVATATASPGVQRLASGSVVQRDEAKGGTKSAEFLREGWVNVNQLGIVYKPGPVSEDGGANLRSVPLPGQGLIEWLPQNTKVFILKRDPVHHWFAVTTLGAKGGRFGYINDKYLAMNLPDPDSDILKVIPGDTPIDIARTHYAKKGFNVWGKDARYVVNALAWVNTRAKHNFPGDPGVAKPSPDAEWYEAKAKAETYIWLPGPAYLNALYETIAEHGGGTGSISADLWRKVKKIYEYAAYGLAFVGGLVHGFVKSLWDAVSGLVEMVVDILVSVFTGNVLSDVKELIDAVSNLFTEEGRKNLKTALGDWVTKWDRKLSSNDPWVAGHAHGYLTGYVMAEAAMLLISAGTLAAAKAAIWGSRFGKALQKTRAFQIFAKGIEATGEAGSKARQLVGRAGATIRETRPFKAIGVAAEWARNAFLLPYDVVANLTLDAINRLRTLSEPVIGRIRNLSARAKRWLLGCASACDVEIEQIKKVVAGWTDADIEAWAARIPEQAASPAVKGGKKPTIEDKRVPRRKTRRLEAEDIPRLPGEKLKDAIARIQKVIGTKISDHASFRKSWNAAREHVLRTNTLTKDNVADVYAKVRKQFWRNVRGNEDALKVLRESGFYLPESEGAAFLGGVKKGIPKQEYRVSLDHSFEKARGDNWMRALDADNLVFEFHNPNSYREIVQMRHVELRTP